MQLRGVILCGTGTSIAHTAYMKWIACVAVALLALGAAATAHAEDTWSKPFPGVDHLHRVTSNQNIHALAIDLCAAGVGVRATAFSERGRTVPSFGQLVGAQAAINGDFFGGGFDTDGLAMSGGTLWPGSADHGYVAPLAFGSHRVEMPVHEAMTAPAPWMTEIVSGHPTILVDGATRASTDPLCTNRHPRTAVGLSADKRTLYLVVVDGRASSRIGMRCDELAALLRELGADDAMNMDGGGSSTMWLQGAGVLNFPSDGSPRTVGNHLAIYARGSGEAAFCPNRTPHGWLDSATCEAVTGWAQDDDSPDAPIDVHVYFGGPAGAEGAYGVSTRADIHRDDLCDAIGSCAHGYGIAPPASFLDGQPHEVWAYGIDSAGGANAALFGSPLTMQCDPPPPPVSADDGQRRHITSPEVLAAWSFDFHDVAPLDDAVIDAFPDGEPLPDTPRLVRATGDSAVYLVDGTTLRHVTDPAAMKAWRFSFDAVADITPEELAMFEIGSPLPAKPFLARGSGPEVYIIDTVAMSSDGGDESGGDTGDTGEDDLGDEPDDVKVASGCSSARGGSSGVALILFLVWLGWNVRRRNASAC